MSGVMADIEACIPALRRYATALLGHRQDADDLVHDSLLRALDHAHTLRNQHGVRPWLFAILHNQFLTQARRNARRRVEPLDEVHESRLAAHDSPEDMLHWRDLLRGLADLPQDYRQVLLLVTVEGFSYAEVAEMLGIPLGTVMSRLSRARERLRRFTAGTAGGEGGHSHDGHPNLRRVK
jgi:RNA polymerase sigma-70 factor (ECF subfamily)